MYCQASPDTGSLAARSSSPVAFASASHMISHSGSLGFTAPRSSSGHLSIGAGFEVFAFTRLISTPDDPTLLHRDQRSYRRPKDLVALARTRVTSARSQRCQWV